MATALLGVWAEGGFHSWEFTVGRVLRGLLPLPSPQASFWLRISPYSFLHPAPSPFATKPPALAGPGLGAVGIEKCTDELKNEAPWERGLCAAPPGPK